MKELEEEGTSVPQVRELVEFVKNSKRGILTSVRFLASYRAGENEE